MPTLASAVLAGVCIGFVPHNFYPARIFMGDTGSMLLGLLLAYAPISSISSLDYRPPDRLRRTVNRFPEILPLIPPAAILIIPYADLLLAVVRRTRAGRSPFAPDRKHLHHRLLDIGHSHRASVLIMYLWATLFSGTVVWLSIAKTPLYILAVVTLVSVLALLLMSMPRLRWWERTGSAGRRGGRPGRDGASFYRGARPRPAQPVAVGAPYGGHAGAPGPVPRPPGPRPPGLRVPARISPGPDPGHRPGPRSSDRA